MSTPEQQAREMLGRMGFTAADFFSAGDLVELANLIERSDALLAELHTALATINKQSHELSALKAEFKIIDEMNDQLREQNTAVDEACAKLEAELAAIKGAGEPVGHVYTMEPCIPGEHVRYHAQMTAKVPAGTKLYTRPCVPLTDEHVRDFVNDVGLDWQSGWTLDECEPNRYVQFARAIEAHIKEPRHDSSN